MQKVVIDTNVIVSSLIQRNYPYLIIRELFIGDKIELCLSEALMQEYCEVLRRPKFTIFYDFATLAEALLADIEAKAVMYIPKIKLNLISDDAIGISRRQFGYIHNYGKYYRFHIPRL